MGIRYCFAFSQFVPSMRVCNLCNVLKLNDNIFWAIWRDRAVSNE